jgi:hypothetical protein
LSRDWSARKLALFRIAQQVRQETRRTNVQPLRNPVQGQEHESSLKYAG